MIHNKQYARQALDRQKKIKHKMKKKQAPPPKKKDTKQNKLCANIYGNEPVNISYF